MKYVLPEWQLDELRRARYEMEQLHSSRFICSYSCDESFSSLKPDFKFFSSSFLKKPKGGEAMRKFLLTLLLLLKFQKTIQIRGKNIEEGKKFLNRFLIPEAMAKDICDPHFPSRSSIFYPFFSMTCDVIFQLEREKFAS